MNRAIRTALAACVVAGGFAVPAFAAPLLALNDSSISTPSNLGGTMPEPTAPAPQGKHPTKTVTSTGSSSALAQPQPSAGASPRAAAKGAHRTATKGSSE